MLSISGFCTICILCTWNVLKMCLKLLELILKLFIPCILDQYIQVIVPIKCTVLNTYEY